MSLLNISVLDCLNEVGITQDAVVFTDHKLKNFHSMALAQIEHSAGYVTSYQSFSPEQVFAQIQTCLNGKELECVRISYVQDLDFLLELLSPFFQRFPEVHYYLDLSGVNISFDEASMSLLSQFDFVFIASSPETHFKFDYRAALLQKEICSIVWFEKESSGHLKLLSSRGEKEYFAKKSTGTSLPFPENALMSSLVANLQQGKKLAQACKNARRYLNQLEFLNK